MYACVLGEGVEGGGQGPRGGDMQCIMDIVVAGHHEQNSLPAPMVMSGPTLALVVYCGRRPEQGGGGGGSKT